MQGSVKLRIGDFLLDASRNVLAGGAGEISLEPKVAAVLTALAAQPSSVLTREELISAVWKSEFGADERLTRAISILRKSFGDDRSEARYIETVAKRGYRLVSPVEIFEPREGGSATVPPVALPETPARRHLHRRVSGGILALAAAAAVAIAVAFLRDSEPSDGRPFVAVLPFDDLSDGGGEFAHGVAEEILYALSKSSDLSVAARSSSFQFTTKNSAEAARTLRATHIVEGTVRSIGSNIRVGVLVQETRSNETIWSDTFERPRTDILHLQNDVAWRVADALGARLMRTRDAPSVDPETYERYLHARDQIRRRENLTEAARDLEAVVGKSPTFARAWSSLAVARYLHAVRTGNPPGFARPDLMLETLQAIQRTQALDPLNGEVLGILARESMIDGQLIEAEDLYDRALKAEPSNATLLNWRSEFYRAVGRRQDASAAIARAHELDRLSSVFVHNLAMGLTEAGQHAKADAVLADRGTAFVQNVEFDRKRARLISDRDWAGLAAYMSGPQFAPPAAFSETYALIAETAEALASKTNDRSYFRERWKEVVHRHPHHRFMAIEYLGYLGDIEGMREHAITIIESRERWQYVGTLFAPSARLLRSDISFVSIMQKAGLWTYWSETGRWPDFCQEKDLPYNCRAEAAKLAAPL